ncbi:unnamed protein product [Dracunculus medinensis]|uniref:CULLIN_2 domain-containing protein n=1 Tax=Dracunculus medinensis TaxID=318479 RepID=A0A0N4URI1_DRAME|nr:unnamed protein product [Dracunculus medinensis]
MSQELFALIINSKRTTGKKLETLFKEINGMDLTSLDQMLTREHQLHEVRRTSTTRGSKNINYMRFEEE